MVNPTLTPNEMNVERKTACDIWTGLSWNGNLHNSSQLISSTSQVWDFLKFYKTPNIYQSPWTNSIWSALWPGGLKCIQQDLLSAWGLQSNTLQMSSLCTLKTGICNECNSPWWWEKTKRVHKSIWLGPLLSRTGCFWCWICAYKGVQNKRLIILVFNQSDSLAS